GGFFPLRPSLQASPPQCWAIPKRTARPPLRQPVKSRPEAAPTTDRTPVPIRMSGPSRAVLARAAGRPPGAPYGLVVTDLVRAQAPVVMGVLNVTPDSFSDGGRYADLDAAVAHGVLMHRQGARLVGVGGRATPPGAQPS